MVETMTEFNKSAIHMVENCIKRGTNDEKISWEIIKNEWYGTNRYKCRDKEWPEFSDYLKEIERIAKGKATIRQEHTGVIRFCYEVSKIFFNRIKES
jgi:hypothetical protein